MDLQGMKFGYGKRELGGAVDLINHYRLWNHHDFFCQRSLPLSISETQYLHNMVGDTEIRKGEGMELYQLLHNNSYIGERNAPINAFDLGTLMDAFRMRETASIALPSTKHGISTREKTKNKSRDRERKEKARQDKAKGKDHKKHKHQNKIGNNNKKDEKGSGIVLKS